jgi:hypothetical protein
MYGTGTRSYNRSAEKHQVDRDRKRATAKFTPCPDSIPTPLRCNCRSFERPHDLEEHYKLKSDFDWRTPAERNAARRTP